MRKEQVLDLVKTLRESAERLGYIKNDHRMEFSDEEEERVEAAIQAAEQALVAAIEERWG